MPDQESWEEFCQEFDSIERKPEYKTFNPLLTKIRAFIGRAEATNNENDRMIAMSLQTFVKQLRAEQAAGKDAQILLDKVAGGFVQPGWRVKGDVKQANHDYMDQSTNIVVNIIRDTASELKLNAQSPKILVPIVPVVMTRDQAEELVSRTAFEGKFQSLKCDFDTLYDYLKVDSGDWLDHYGKTPTEWKPFGTSSTDATLEELIESALKGLEQELPGLDRPLAASFRDVVALSEPDNRLSLLRMRNQGCIVIVDVISIRHPALQRAFHQSLLDAYPRTSTVSIAPNQGSYKIATQLAVMVQLKVEEMEFQRRLNDTGDYGASKKLYEEESLRPWLSSRVKNIESLVAIMKGGAPKVV